MKGLVHGARECRCAIIGGETAVIPDIIKGGKKPFDLTFTVVGRMKKQILGDKIEPGNVIVGLESSGLHSNGYTLARRTLDSKKWGAEMLKPTKIYAAPVLEMIDSCQITGIAHITGGGYSKLTRLNKNVGFELNNMPKLTPLYEAMMEKVKDVVEMYKTFNMGIGMCIMVPKGEEQKIIQIAKKHGVNASVIGKITTKAGVKLIKEGKEYDLVI